MAHHGKRLGEDEGIISQGWAQGWMKACDLAVTKVMAVGVLTPLFFNNLRELRLTSPCVRRHFKSIMDLNHIHELYDYNRWANQRSLSAATKLDKAAFLRPMGNSFSSVRDTLAHILGAEWIWLERWNGVSPAALLDAAGFPTAESLQARWETVEQNRRRFLASLKPERLREEISYTNTRGERFSYVLWRQMAHVVNHSTYHRGQVTRACFINRFGLTSDTYV